MRYRYLVDLRRGISVFAIFSYGIAVLGTPQCPPHNDILALWRLRPMFTQAALRASVFVLKRFFFVKFSVLIRQSVRFFFTDAWPKRDSTHTVDSNFQRSEIIFLEYRARKAAWVNMGFLIVRNWDTSWDIFILMKIS